MLRWDLAGLGAQTGVVIPSRRHSLRESIGLVGSSQDRDGVHRATSRVLGELEGS